MFASKQKMVAPEVEVVNGAHANGSVPKSMGGADSAQKGHAASYQASQVILPCLDLSIGPHKRFEGPQLHNLMHCIDSSQGHIGQQPLDAVPSFGGSTSSTTEGSYRLWDPSKVPTPRKIVAALDKFIVGQEATKKVQAHYMQPLVTHALRCRNLLIKPFQAHMHFMHLG